jgi:Spy/CpxP family protein refolding chaperone
MTMKKIIITLASVCLLTALTGFAEEGKKERAKPQPGQFAGRAFGGIVGPEVAQKLNLTDDQKQKAAEISQKFMPQMAEIRKQMMEELRAILTDEQKKTLDEAMEQMRQRFQQGAGKGEGKGGRRSGGENK